MTNNQDQDTRDEIYKGSLHRPIVRSHAVYLSRFPLVLRVSGWPAPKTRVLEHPLEHGLALNDAADSDENECVVLDRLDGLAGFWPVEHRRELDAFRSQRERFVMAI